MTEESEKRAKKAAATRKKNQVAILESSSKLASVKAELKAYKALIAKGWTPPKKD